MRFRIAAAVAVAGTLLLSMSGADAATPVMDGKRVKVLKLTASGGTQDHDSDGVTGFVASRDTSTCTPPRCALLKFVYKPAKGAKGGLMVTATWGKQALSDYDLYMFELDKRGNGTDVGHCGGVGTASERVYLPPASLHSGKTYLMVIDFFRSVDDKVSATIEMGVPSTVKTTVPAKADGVVYNVNCVL